MDLLEQRNLESEADTQTWAAEIATHLKSGDIVKITGPLGAGKTTFVRAIVSALGGDVRHVHSPTFSLVHEYQTRGVDIIHCDFYRLPPGSELDEFGGLEFFDSDHIFFVEWPERVGLFESPIPNRLWGVDLQVEGVRRVARLFGPRLT